MYIDTHTHIYLPEFEHDRAQVLARARTAGVEKLLLPNIDEASLRPMLELCGQAPGVCFPMLGLHPTELPADPWPTLHKMEQMLDSPQHPFIAVGEVGIDLYWDSSRKQEQIEVFRHQARLACRHRLPLVVHSRAAHAEVVKTLLPFATELTGIFHCFGGTICQASELLETFPGFCLGIGGTLTFKKSTLPEVLAQLPPTRLVLETDAPYLAPTPHRGTRNEPAYIPIIAQTLASTLGIPLPQLAEILRENSLRIFTRLN